MRTSLAAVLTASALLASGLAASKASAAQVDGLWQAPDDGAQIQLTDTAGALTGKVMTSGRIKASPSATDVKNPDAALRGRMLKGLVFMTGFSGGPAQWTGGKLYDPKDGKTYTGKLTLVDANTLKLQGCIVYPLCRTDTWTRIR